VGGREGESGGVRGRGEGAEAAQKERVRVEEGTEEEGIRAGEEKWGGEAKTRS
jgi:hypothetical protein